jgi:hypothetical protein
LDRAPEREVAHGAADDPGARSTSTEALGDLYCERTQGRGKVLNRGTRHYGLELTVTTTDAVSSEVPRTPGAATASASSSRLLDYVTIGAIVLVVALVSVPQLRGFALRENELDAMRTLRLIAAQPAPANIPVGRCDLAYLVAHDASLRRRLEDVEYLSDGRVRRHGYLFDIASMQPGEPMLRAWPWSPGTTGRGAFVWTPQRGLLGCANKDGVFAGPNGAPEAEDVDANWLSITYRR